MASWRNIIPTIKKNAQINAQVEKLNAQAFHALQEQVATHYQAHLEKLKQQDGMPLAAIAESQVVLDAIEARIERIPKEVDRLVDDWLNAAKSGSNALVAQVDGITANFPPDAGLEVKNSLLQTAMLFAVHAYGLGEDGMPEAQAEQYIAYREALGEALFAFVVAHDELSMNLPLPKQLAFLGTRDVDGQADTRMSRRQFLVRGTLAAAGLYLGGEAIALLLDPEMRAAAGLPFRRQIPEGQGFEFSDAYLEELWNEHFDGQQHIMTLDVWKNMAQHGLRVLATLYFDNVRGDHLVEEQEQIDFEEYFREYMQLLHKAADYQDMNLTTMISLLRVSADNTNWNVRYNEDVRLSENQLLLGAVASHFDNHPILGDYIGFGAVADMVTTREWRGDDPLKARIGRFLTSHAPLSHYESIRLTGIETIGMKDIESELIAAAILEEKEGGYALKVQGLGDPKYYDAINALAIQLSARQKYQEAKTAVREEVQAYIEEFARYEHSTLKYFFSTDEVEQKESYEAIGITNPPDSRISHQYNRFWEKAVVLGGGDLAPSEFWEETVDSYRNNMDKIRRNDGVVAGYTAIMRDQLLNERFIDFLKQNAEEGHKERQALYRIERALKTLEKAGKKVRVAKADAYAKLATPEMDQDINWQIQTSVAVCKMLSEEAEVFSGPVDHASRDSVLMNAMAALSIREISPTGLLTHSRDEVCDWPYIAEYDLPYNRPGVLHFLKAFYDGLGEYGYFRDDAPNFDSFLTAYEWFKDDTGDIESVSRRALRGDFEEYVYPRFYSSAVRAWEISGYFYDEERGIAGVSTREEREDLHREESHVSPNGGAISSLCDPNISSSHTMIV